MTETNTVKMGRRLQQIMQMIDKRYTHIWDCCCDHGLLGFNLLEAQQAEMIHFVDVVPQLLSNIKNTLQKHDQGDKSNWQVHCIDAGCLPIRAFSKAPQTDKHLIIIAGVGGDLTIKLLQALQCFSDYNIEYILCPVHHIYKVRQFLIEQQLRLINERLVFENKRGYEIIHVSAGGAKAISKIGAMWDLKEAAHREYLDKTISHYQRIAKNPNIDVADIINQYRVISRQG